VGQAFGIYVAIGMRVVGRGGAEETVPMMFLYGMGSLGGWDGHGEFVFVGL